MLDIRALWRVKFVKQIIIVIQIQQIWPLRLTFCVEYQVTRYVQILLQGGHDIQFAHDDGHFEKKIFYYFFKTAVILH